MRALPSHPPGYAGDMGKSQNGVQIVVSFWNGLLKGEGITTKNTLPQTFFILREFSKICFFNLTKFIHNQIFFPLLLNTFFLNFFFNFFFLHLEISKQFLPDKWNLA